MSANVGACGGRGFPTTSASRASMVAACSRVSFRSGAKLPPPTPFTTPRYAIFSTFTSVVSWKVVRPLISVEELQSLICELEQKTDRSDVVNLHLPAVTYDGGLVIEDRPFHLYGSTDGEQKTTFTDTVRIMVKNSWITNFNDIDFVGDGSGVGISATSRVRVLNGTIAGWRTGVLAYGDAWVNVINCLVEENAIGLHYNSTGGNVDHSYFGDNRFISNETGIYFEHVPTDVTLNFKGTLFSGNGTDIDNRCNQPLDLSEAVFQ